MKHHRPQSPTRGRFVFFSPLAPQRSVAGRGGVGGGEGYREHTAILRGFRLIFFDFSNAAFSANRAPNCRNIRDFVCRVRGVGGQEGQRHCGGEA